MSQQVLAKCLEWDWHLLRGYLFKGVASPAFPEPKPERIQRVPGHFKDTGGACERDFRNLRV